ncbi:MAG: multicopper oxidase domain-containing protein [Candidatus Binatia bacterium]
MNATTRLTFAVSGLLVTALLVLYSADAHAVIDGVVYDGVAFNLRAKVDHIQTPDGGAPLIWGYTAGTRAQYPGPTLIVNEGDNVVVSLVNDIPDLPVSIVFPGQDNVTTIGGTPGLMTQEAPADGTTVVTYTFTASHPGTYMYHSGTRPELEVEMGLFGALIVRPSLGSDHAYNHADSFFDREYLFLHSEMDPRIHDTVEFEGVAALDNTDYLANYDPNYWFYNGRAAPDTLFPAGVPWLPTQPYNILPLMHPGDKVLLRIIGGGRDMHPFHPHGNHVRIIARDGRLLESSPGAGADLSHKIFTIPVAPGETFDTIFEWTGKGLGYDVYGTTADGPQFAHDCIDNDGDGFDDTNSEYCADHGKPLPVTIPEGLELAFGGFWSGSPFLGSSGALPPGEGGLNPGGGYTFPWHSHSEKEIINYGIFPGGQLTFVIVLDHGIPLP